MAVLQQLKSLCDSISSFLQQARIARVSMGGLSLKRVEQG